MRKLLSVLLLAGCTISAAPPKSFDPALLADIDRAIESAIAAKRAPGAVFHLEQGDAVYEKAYGNRALVPAAEPMTTDTIFDAASITKTVAATPAVWLLIERGKIGIDDRVQKYIPDFPHADVTIRHLLTHTSGLRPDLDLKDPWQGYDTAMKLINQEKLTNKPGMMFRYSDINFELLGEIVHRVSGVPFDEFVKREIFAPLKMNDSTFNPKYSTRIAPTDRTDGTMLRGVVHDPTARRMGGVAGHAGLFTTVADLSKFFRMLLRGGSPIFKPETVAAMTSVQSPENVAVKRTGGFDYDSGFSRNRGDYFPLGSYGHTGFTGGAFWVDPKSKTFYILMTNRVHPDGGGNVDALRREVANISARAVGYTEPVTRRVGLIMSGSASNGIDVVAARGYEQLRGMRIGLITNHTGIDRSGNPTIDLLRSAPGVNLVALFSPEHGIRGTEDKEEVGDTTDTVSGLPIYSLYDGKRRKPLPEHLANLDALVFDIQDIGCRFYTYISTLGLAMEAAAESHKKFIVLDRVNPISGMLAEGPLLKGAPDFVAWHPITVSHGMTVGEIAKMFNEERGINADLTVIEVRGWKRDQFQDEAGLPWINTSPNMRSLNAATLYPGTGLLESALSVGRGTPTPFEILGAPYVREKELADELNALGVTGVSFTPIRFTPTTSTYANQSCGGVRVTLTDRHALRPVEMGVAIATVFQKLYPGQFEIEKMQRLLRDRVILDAIRGGMPWREIAKMWRDDEKVFAARRAKHLIYK